MEEEIIDPKEAKKVAGIALIITVGLILTVILFNQWTMTRASTIVLPAGGTYLGPPTGTPTAAPNTLAATDGSMDASGKVTFPESTAWKTVNGLIYPYTFDVPQGLELKTFPNDPYDIYAIVWGSIDPSSAVLVGVDNLKNKDNLKPYMTKPKSEYVNSWWKQFGALKGVASVKPFTNSQGLQGYKAKFVTGDGATPNLDVFFEVPEHPEYVIHLANGILAPAVFDKIIDSVAWEEK